MSQYRRLQIPGQTYFFTVRLQDRSSTLLVRRADLLRDTLRLCKKRWPFEIEAAVILPDHLHMIWTLPDCDGDFSKRWRLIKSTFSRHADRPAEIAPSKAERGEKGIWQRRFWEHRIRDEADFIAHRSYLLTAPVRAGLIARSQDWALSSIHRDLARGLPVPIDRMGGYGPFPALV